MSKERLQAKETEPQQIASVSCHESLSYPVWCGDHLETLLEKVWRNEWHQVAIVGDTNTLPLFGARIAEFARSRAETVLELSFAAGEEHKTRETKLALENSLLGAAFDRGSCIIAVGGGIALDVAGFVAATYLRGVAHINVATTLLAQVDAAIGGKTGVNTAEGKNLIGAFHHPRAVVIDRTTLRSLPDDELRQGWAEAIKHAVLADANLFATIETWSQRNELIPPLDILARCVAIKAAVVAEDAREAGRRQVLNFGHTVAHALESLSGHEISHGSAVAIGMVVEAHVAERLCGFPAEDITRLTRILTHLGLPTRPMLSFGDAAQYFDHDKKTRRGSWYCALPRAIGTMDNASGHWVVEVPRNVLEQAWNVSSQGRIL